MSRSEGGSGGPQAIIHKRILDVAEANPDAPLEAIADRVTGASVDLVDRVLEEYGDPGDGSDTPPGDDEQLSDSSDTEDSTGERMPDTKTTDGPTVDTGEDEQATADTEAESHQAPDRSDLSEKQLDALRLIRERPEATQREMAEELDVTAATVSRRLNDIPGFEWDRRESFVSRTLNGDTTTKELSEDPTAEAEDPDGSGDGSGTDPIEDLGERVATLEREMEKACEDSPGSGLDPDLLHKVIHACMASEHVTEEEELRILDGLVGEEG